MYIYEFLLLSFAHIQAHESVHLNFLIFLLFLKFNFLPFFFSHPHNLLCLLWIFSFPQLLIYIFVFRLLFNLCLLLIRLRSLNICQLIDGVWVGLKLLLKDLLKKRGSFRNRILCVILISLFFFFLRLLLFLFTLIYLLYLLFIICGILGLTSWRNDRISADLGIIMRAVINCYFRYLLIL